MWRIAQVGYREFGPFHDATLYPGELGVTTVEGRVDLPGCDSNGAGKSALIEGIAWCLYGRCIRPKWGTDDVVRNGGKNCSVAVELLDSSGRHLTAHRFRKHDRHKNNVYLYIDGVDSTRGTNDQTTAAIEAELGMDFPTFVNTVAFGTHEDVAGFFSATDSQRKAILDRLLGLTLYAQAEKIARIKLRDATKEIAELESECARWRDAIEGADNVLAKFADDEDVIEAAIALQRLRLRKIAADRQVRESAALLEKAKTATATARAKHKLSQEVYQKQFDAQSAKQKTHADARHKALMEVSLRNGKIETLKKAIGQVEGIKAKCPTCRQDVPAAHRGKIKAALEKEIAQMEHECSCLELEADLSKRQAEDIVFPAEPDNAEYAAAVNAETEAVTRHGHVLNQRAHFAAQLSREQAAYDGTALRVQAIEIEREQAQDKLNEAMFKLEQKSKDAVTLEFWAEGFGNAGLKSYMIEAELPNVNALATAKAQRMLGPGAYVKLSATKMLKTKDVAKEELTVQASIPGMAQTYSAASKGQKRRMDLCILLAFRELAALRAANGIDQLFIDEVFDGMDETGTEVIADLCRELAEDRPVLLVTHDDRLKTVADYSVVVTHDGEQATVETDVPSPDWDAIIHGEQAKPSGAARPYK